MKHIQRERERVYVTFSLFNIISSSTSLCFPLSYVVVNDIPNIEELKEGEETPTYDPLYISSLWDILYI